MKAIIVPEIKLDYYTPDIDELYVGYELELQNIENAQWGRYTITSDEDFGNFMDALSISECLQEEMIRTKYLTKEQLEAEGWVEVKFKSIYPCFKKGDAHLEFDENDAYIYGCDPYDDVWYKGTCRSINELRKIIKLLNIE